ncbi:MAG: FAD-dependent oxidoreductase [Acidimicrobiia bacterium]|nr:FAD-dependent oxidoreductase [Acidimicrobiia bacterium]
MNARAVIIGGGIVGSALAYHLTVVHGWNNIVLIDQGDLPENPGSTSHAPGGVVANAHNKTLTDMAQYSADLYESLPNPKGPHHTFRRYGGIELTRTPERYEDMVRLNGEMAGWGYESRMLSPEETYEYLPFIDPKVITGSLFSPASGLVKGVQVVDGFLNLARATGGLDVHPNTAFRDVVVVDGRVVGVETAIGHIKTDTAVLAANIWSPALAHKLGAIPLMAFQHHYAITHPLKQWSDTDHEDPDLEAVYPLIRDLDAAMYYRRHWDALGIGSYHHVPQMVDPRDVGPDAMRPFTPEHFGDAWRLAREMVPMLRDSAPEFQKAYNGMFAFSADGMPILGESLQARGFWSANASWITHAGGVAKSVAEWMVEGETEWDMRQCHLHRFQEHVKSRQYIDVVTQKNYREVYDLIHPKQPITEPRNVRLSPYHAEHVAAEARFTAFAGFELPNWYESNAGLADELSERIPSRTGLGSQWWSPIMGAEHLAIRENAGLMDLTGLSIVEVSGPGASEIVGFLCSNETDVEIGKVVYTCWLTPGGGIKRDLTVTRLDSDRYWMFVGEGTLPQDLEWVRRHAPSSVTVNDISPAYTAVGIWGPHAHRVIERVMTEEDLKGFDFYTARWIEIAMTGVFAMRISYVGEYGFELHIPIDSAHGVWNALRNAGEDVGLTLCGLGAMDSLRLEKGYRLWGGDIHTEYNVYEAGLGWTAKLNKPDFIGRAATASAKAAPLEKKLTALAIDDPAATLLNYESVWNDDEPVSYVTSANYGYSIGRYIAYTYLPIELTEPGTALSVEYIGERYPAEVVTEPLWDPKMERMRQ